MVIPRRPKQLFLIASTALLAAGFAVLNGNADDTSGAGVTGVAPATTTEIKRSQPNGRTDVIKAVADPKKYGDWIADIERS